MRILVFSDSHGSVSEMDDVIERFPCDMFIHLGDTSRDANIVAEQSNKPMISVAGNCDMFPKVPYSVVTDICGYNFYICHGNAFMGDERLISAEAKANNCNVALFGHTHVPMDTVIDGVRIINPGSIGRPKYEFPKKSYALIEIVSGRFNCRLCTY